LRGIVLAGTSDLFLQSRIAEATKSLGFDTKFAAGQEELKEVAKVAVPKLAVLDLASDEYDPFSCARALKLANPSLRILGFFPHVRTELRTRAESSGIDYIVPNSGLLKALKNVLSKEVAGR